MINQEKIKELVERFSIANKNKDYINAESEENIKSHYIEPLFESLGWTRWEMNKEQRVLKGRADYIFKIGNEEVLVIEAKRVGATLSEEDGRQAVSYAYHRKIKFAVLTNFKEVRVYHALSNIKNIDKNILKFEDDSLFRLNFEQFLEKIDKLKFLSKESFEKQEINKLLSKKDEKTLKPIDVSVLSDLLQIRELLSKDLKKLRMQLSQPQIDEAVQILINRLIFIRSVEDRGLEAKFGLLNIEKDFKVGRLRKRIWDELLENFKNFDKTYNSKLFAHSILEDENIFFDDETLSKTIRILYYGSQDVQALYMFDEIPGDLLGSIYEQYLGTVLQETEKRVKLDKESGKRKKMGIYYTPSYIVDYIIKNTVGEYIKDKTIDEILEVNIVDPACGSGSFLLRAFQEVCNTIEEKLKKGEKAKTSTFTFYNENRLNLSQKISILTNCIYGVDLDEKAIELAQLNLLLKILEDETPTAHKHLLPNLRENIKCGNSLIDDPKVAGDKAFNWNAQFPEAFHKGGFDVVVGNPPYGADLPEKDRKSLENKFNLRNTDTACIFMSLVSDLLKKEGINGFIVPKPFVYSSTWKLIREKLLSGLAEIVDVGKVWKEVKLEQVIYFYNKDKIHKFYNSSVRKNKEIKKIGEINKETFEEFGFLLNGVSDKELSVARNIKNKGISLNEFVINQRGAIYQKEVVDKKSDLMVLGGMQVGRYIINSEIKGYIPKKVVKDDKAFIKQKSILVQRLVAHIENPIDHIKITASLSKDLNISDYIIVDTINQLQNKGKVSSEFLIAIINSKLTNWYAYRFIFGKAIRTMQFDNPVSNRIIIPKPSASQEKNMIGLVDQMLALQKKLHEGKPSGNEKERLEQQIKNTDYEIDQEVYKLYGLTKEEIKIVEESLE